jgi:PIN domain nuclease of toxin-antitoxin system
MLWAIGRSPRLRRETRALLADPGNAAFVSAISVWEASIKVASGKLTLSADLLETLEASRFEPLEVTHLHALEAGGLPPHHRDPFDRMLVAQARLEGLTLVTTDRRLAAYDVALLPA